MLCSSFSEHKDKIMDKRMGVNKGHAFITGSENLKKSTVTEHEKTPSHLKAVAIQQGIDDAPKSNAGRALLALQEKDRQWL